MRKRSSKVSKHIKHYFDYSINYMPVISKATNEEWYIVYVINHKRSGQIYFKAYKTQSVAYKKYIELCRLYKQIAYRESKM